MEYSSVSSVKLSVLVGHQGTSCILFASHLASARRNSTVLHVSVRNVDMKEVMN